MFLISTQDIRRARIGGSATAGCGARWVLLEWCSQDPLGEGNPTKTGVDVGTTRQPTKVAKTARRFPLKGKHTRNEHPPFTYPSLTSSPVLSSSTSGDSRPRFNFPAAARFLHGIPGQTKTKWSLSPTKNEKRRGRLWAHVSSGREKKTRAIHSRYWRTPALQHRDSLAEALGFIMHTPSPCRHGCMW